MFFRHLYATVQPTLQQRCESWDNYCALFNIILGSSINMQVCSPSERPCQYSVVAILEKTCETQVAHAWRTPASSLHAAHAQLYSPAACMRRAASDMHCGSAAAPRSALENGNTFACHC